MDVETDNPESYVRENGNLPIRDVTVTANGDIIITTGDVVGNMVRYTFTE